MTVCNVPESTVYDNCIGKRSDDHPSNVLKNLEGYENFGPTDLGTDWDFLWKGKHPLDLIRSQFQSKDDYNEFCRRGKLNVPQEK